MLKKFSFSRITHEQILDFPLYVHPMAPQDNTIWHEHEFVELVLIQHGTGENQIAEHNQKLQRGDILVIPRGVVHRYCHASGDFTLINILFIPEALPMPTLDSAILPGTSALFARVEEAAEPEVWFYHCEERDFAPLEMLAQELACENRQRHPGYLFTSFGLFMALSGQVARLFSRAQPLGQTHFNHISKVIAHLNRHFQENVTIDELCRIGNMSRSTLQRSFTRTTGTSPVEYVLQLRIAQAVTMLRTGDQNLAEISLELGFSDSSYFGKHFKRIMGMSPGAFRRQCRNC